MTVDTTPVSRRRDRSHILYIAVLVAVALGILVGLLFPDFGKELRPVGTGFVNLIKMMIAPIIFCTIVLGVGKVGGLALAYFLIMSTVALAIGLVVGNILQPGSGLHLSEALAKTGQAQVGQAKSTTDFLLGIIPDTLFSSVTSGQVLQALLVA